MKREIKFRGKRVDNGEWVYGFLTWVTDSSLSWMSSDDSVGDIRVVTKSVGQFTGITDKNGKEIYEGDKLILIGTHASWKEGHWHVEFKDHTASFVLVLNGSAISYVSIAKIQIDAKNHNASFEFEITGNIHEQ